jgi:hypothetical protein
MVAVAEPLTMFDRPVRVALAAGEEASGLASMIGQYVEQIIADSPEKRAEAAALRGRLGLHAREGNVAVTIVFAGGGVVIEEGLREPNAVIAGEVEFLMHVLAGRANPVWELAGGHVTIRPSLQRPLFAYRAYRLMRLPDVHVWSGLPRPPTRLLVGAAAAATLIVVVWRVRSARREVSDA